MGHAAANVIPSPAVSFQAALRLGACPRQDAEFSRLVVSSVCCCSPRQDAARVTKRTQISDMHALLCLKPVKCPHQYAEATGSVIIDPVLGSCFS